MKRRGFTTISVRKKTYEDGRRWMEAHGYTSWEGMIRGTITGHQLPAKPTTDLSPILQRLEAIEKGLQAVAKPNPSNEKEIRTRLGKIESLLEDRAKLEEFRSRRMQLKELRAELEARGQ